MNTEQERADFEAWVKTHYYLSELGLDFEDDEYVDMEVQGRLKPTKLAEPQAFMPTRSQHER